MRQADLSRPSCPTNARTCRRPGDGLVSCTGPWAEYTVLEWLGAVEPPALRPGRTPATEAGSSPAVLSVLLDDRAPGRAEYRCRAMKVARPARGLRLSATLAGMRRAYGPPEVLLRHQAFVVSEVNSTCGAAIQIPGATGGFSQVRGCRVGRRAVRRRWALHTRLRWRARGTRRVQKVPDDASGMAKAPWSTSGRIWGERPPAAGDSHRQLLPLTDSED
jgi:hypothetical protein